MAKPFSVKHATAALSKYRDRAPSDYFEKQEVTDILRRLPIAIDDELVVIALVHDITESRSVDNSQATCLLTATPVRGVPPNPERWARAVVRAMQRFETDPHAAFYLAALPADEAAWASHMKHLDQVHGGLKSLWNPNRYDAAQREHVIRPFASDAAVVAGARAAARLSVPSKYDGWWWVLAAEGSAESLPLIESFVETLGKDPTELDLLASELAPLMTSRETAALRAKLMRAFEERNAKSPGLAVAHELGIETDALRFKVGLYADGGMPRIRMWIDSSKDPWYDARWNWEELVTTPKVPEGASPIDELRVFLRSCIADGKGRFRTWELATAHRGDARKRIVAFLAAELKELEGPKPASAPLVSFKG